MLRFLTDENFNADIVRALAHQHLDLDVVRVQDVGLEGADDPLILNWSAANDRIVLTHDRATMPDFAYKRILSGKTMPGLFVVNDRASTSLVLNDIRLICAVSAPEEWRNLVIFIPL